MVLMIVLGAVFASSAGIGLACIAVDSPLQIERRLTAVLGVWTILGMLLGVRVIPENWIFLPIALWFVSCAGTLWFLKQKYPGVVKGQYVLPLK